MNTLFLRWLQQERRPVRPVMFLQWLQWWGLLSMPSVQKTSVMETLPYVSVATWSYRFQRSSFAKECRGCQAATETGAMQRLSGYTLKAFICCYIAMKHWECFQLSMYPATSHVECIVSLLNLWHSVQLHSKPESIMQQHMIVTWGTYDYWLFSKSHVQTPS